MIILGIVLLIAGFVLKISILWTIGIVLLVIGVVLMLMGRMDALSASPPLLLAATGNRPAYPTRRHT
jgi:hypothetical protein